MPESALLITGHSFFHQYIVLILEFLEHQPDLTGEIFKEDVYPYLTVQSRKVSRYQIRSSTTLISVPIFSLFFFS